ncbi:NosD domain-containing protein [Chloroflexota bacterium]
MRKKLSLLLSLVILTALLIPGNIVSADPLVIPVTEPGTLDVPGATYVLQDDIDGGLVIIADGITLDGNGFSVLGPGAPYPTLIYGIKVQESTSVIIKNINVESFWTGIELYQSNSSKVIDSNLDSNMRGISLAYSNSNTIESNTISTEFGYSLYIRRSHYNNIRDNSISSAFMGMDIGSSRDNIIDENTVDSLGTGIYLNGTTGTALTNNVIINAISGMKLSWANSGTILNNTISDTYRSVHLRYSKDNLFIGNIIRNNRYEGMLLLQSSGNILYHNYFIDNSPQIRIEGTATGENTFNLDMPIGGNYWDNWTNPDDDGNGIVDIPYSFFPGMQDNFPWVEPDGWLNNYNVAPVANAGSDQNVEQANSEGTEVILDGLDSSDPDSDPLTFSWSAEGIEFDNSTSSTPSAIFPSGITVVELVVNDGAANSEPDVVVITVTDTTPPIAIAPEDISVIAANPIPINIGIATATDEVGVVSIENNAPAIFPIGNTIVLWTATDAAGNIGSAIQLVTVQTPEEAAQVMISDLETLLLPTGIENSLISKLENTLKSLGKGNIGAAVNQLKAFINQIEAQRGKALSEEQANSLIEAILTIIDAL